MNASSFHAATDPIERLNALKNWETGSRRRMHQSIAPMRDLMARLGNPHLKLSAIHVTGTKGKGSVCAMLESALHGGGVRAGRYSSPHIHHMTERISLRCRPIAEDELRDILSSVLDMRDQASLAGTPASEATWFDAITAAAFLSFARAKIDWVVVETGIGGRLDSTNVLDGRVCVVTNIALEHTDVLGNSLEKIAQEKAGIFKKGCLVVTGEQPGSCAFEVLRAEAMRMEAPFLCASPRPGVTEQNAQIARTVLGALGSIGVRGIRGEDVVNEAMLDAEAVSAALLPGRLERSEVQGDSRRIPVLIDGAHVDIALRAVLDEASSMRGIAGSPVVLFALSRDKDAERMLLQLATCARHIVFTTIHDRAIWDPMELATLARRMNIPCSTATDVAEGLKTCIGMTDSEGWLLVTGSLHLCEPAQNAMKKL